MNIFNSLGSNYDFNLCLKSLFSFNANQSELGKILEEKYGGRAVLLYKGRQALQLALQTLNLPKDSYVAINGFTCFAVYESIKSAGLKIEYLDIERGDLNFPPEVLKLRIKINPKIKAVIVQNTLGYPCDIEKIAEICKNNQIILIEDLAHSVGGKYENGQEMGTVGDLVVLSFSQDKMIDGISGGALIIRNNSSLAEEFAKVSDKQQFKDRFYPLLTFLIRKTYPFAVGKILHKILKMFNLLSNPMGVDSTIIHKLSNWYCPLIKSQFDHLESNLIHRKKIASIYNQMISQKIISKTISGQINLSSNLRFPIFVNNRESLMKYLTKYGIYVSDIWYDGPIAPKKYLSQTSYAGECPNSELASSEILNLPTHQSVSEEDAQKISELINKWLTLK